MATILTKQRPTLPNRFCAAPPPSCVLCGAVPACHDSQGKPSCARERAGLVSGTCLALLVALVGLALIWGAL